MFISRTMYDPKIELFHGFQPSRLLPDRLWGLPQPLQRRVIGPHNETSAE
jgi:hypothetical protein